MAIYTHPEPPGDGGSSHASFDDIKIRKRSADEEAPREDAIGSQTSATLLAELTRSIDAVITAREIESALLRPIAGAIGADATALFELDVDDGSPRDIREATLSSSIVGVLAPYRRSLFRDDPLYSTPPRKPTAMSAIMRETSRPEISAYYDNFLVPQGIGDIVGVHFPVMTQLGQRAFSVSFTRRTGSPSYSLREEALLGDVLPLIALACANVALREDLAALQARIDGMTLPAHGSSAEMSWHRSLRNGPALDVLTEREREIASLVYDGHTNLSMASLLKISTRTVENHLRNIYEKIGIRSRMQLATWIRLNRAN
ncbi:helix-turn-helix transcriptional regulator [Sphingomonas sp. C8-2]|jgi:DNA-binding CsgD family transcriptional regulator|nr:helix-turn-helix transcriptional regulator [Sphingomonas sp. C8-2]